MRYLAWSLYIISKRYYEPGNALSEKQIQYVGPLVSKLAEILFREDANPELLIVTILALGRVLHMHPPSDIVTQILLFIGNSILLSYVGAGNNTSNNAVLC